MQVSILVGNASRVITVDEEGTVEDLREVAGINDEQTAIVGGAVRDDAYQLREGDVVTFSKPRDKAGDVS